jgi:hypothetical protein
MRSAPSGVLDNGPILVQSDNIGGVFTWFAPCPVLGKGPISTHS